MKSLWKYRSVLFNLALAVSLIFGAVGPAFAQDNNPVQDPNAVQQNQESANTVFLPLMALNTLETPPAGVQFRKLVIVTNSVRAAELGVETAAACREFEPVDAVAAAGVSSVCPLEYIGPATICTYQHNPHLCAMLNGEWFATPLQEGDADLPRISVSDALVHSLYTRQCDPADNSCEFVQIDLRPVPGQVSALVSPGSSSAATNKMNVARKFALDRIELANNGVPQFVNRVIAGQQVMYSRPPALIRRGVLEELCGQYIPAEVYMRASASTIQRANVYVEVRFYEDALGLKPHAAMNACMSTLDAEWTTYDNYRALMSVAYKDALDKEFEKIHDSFGQNMATVGVGADWALQPAAFEDVAFETAKIGLYTIIIYLLSSAAQSGALAY